MSDVSVLERMLKDMLVEGAPNIKRQSTNALRNSIKITSGGLEIGGNSGNTYVDYAPYTNEKWINRPGTNPNEGWINRLTLQAVNIFAEKYGYKVVY